MWVEKEVGFHCVVGDWNCVTTDETRVGMGGMHMLQADALAAHTPGLATVLSATGRDR